MSFSGAVAGCSDSNHMAKKRRRWSTAPQEAVLAPNRFGAKKQMKVLGRQHPSSASVSCSLASFQSKSNPIFEPSEGEEEAEAAAAYSSNNSNNNCMPEAGERRFPCTWYNNPSHEATPPEGLTRRSPGRGSPGGRGAELHKQQPHPKPKSRLGKISPESSLLCDHADVGSGGEEEEDEIGIGDPIQLLHSPAINGKSNRITRLLLGQPSEDSLNVSGEGEWPEALAGKDSGVNQKDSRILAVSVNSEDGAQSVEQPPCLIEDGSQKQVDMLSALEASERRSRELVEKVQANAAAELAQLRAYKSVVERLREECTRHEAAAKEWSDMHRDAAAQLLSAREEITELERQRSLQEIAIEGFKEKEGVKRDLQDAMAVSDKLKIETLEKEQTNLRKKVETLETDLMAAESELSAVALREVRREAEATEAAQNEDGTQHVVKEAQMRGAENEGEIGDGFNRSPLESAAEAPSVMKLSEMEAQLAAMSERMEKLQTERNELHIAAQDAGRRADEAHKERDVVVLAVQQEWDSVKVALRTDKEKLERELVVVREQNSKLQSELLHTKNTILEEGKKRQESRNLDGGGADKAESLQVYIGGKIIEPGTERGDSLIALWNEYQKLEAELSEAFDQNKRQKSDRETLNVALDGVRKGNRKLEGEREALNAALVGARDGNKNLEEELCHLQAEKAKLEGERDALMTTVREERQRLENERAAVCKAMMGENEKLESEREVLIAMQEYLKKLEMKKELAQPIVGGDEKRRRKGKRGAASQS